MKRIKQFYAYNDNLDEKINEWLKINSDCELIDIKFQVSNGNKHALLIYNKKEEIKL